MTSDTETADHLVPQYPQLQPQPERITLKEKPARAVPGSTTMANPSISSAKLRDAADTGIAKPWLSLNTLRTVIQLVSILTFAALLVPYTQYSRAKKAIEHETCKTDCHRLCESNLARCDANAARNFSLRGGVLGLSWLEIMAIMVAGFAWQYLIWSFQGLLAVRMYFIKNGSEVRK